jgi:hypothetical protein
MNWLLNRLKEESSWRGIVLLVTALGVKLDPERGEAIIALGLAVVGLINVLRKEQATVPGGKFNPRARVRKATLPSNSRGGNFRG